MFFCLFFFCFFLDFLFGLSVLSQRRAFRSFVSVFDDVLFTRSSLHHSSTLFTLLPFYMSISFLILLYNNKNRGPGGLPRLWAFGFFTCHEELLSCILKGLFLFDFCSCFYSILFLFYILFCLCCPSRRTAGAGHTTFY